jgi:hypothetical protein
MQELLQTERDKKRNGEVMLDGVDVLEIDGEVLDDFDDSQMSEDSLERPEHITQLRRELSEIRELLSVAD